MKCPACKENAEFVEVGPQQSRCQNCGSLIQNEELEPSEEDDS